MQTEGYSIRDIIRTNFGVKFRIVFRFKPSKGLFSCYLRHWHIIWLLAPPHQRCLPPVALTFSLKDVSPSLSLLSLVTLTFDSVTSCHPHFLFQRPCHPHFLSRRCVSLTLVVSPSLKRSATWLSISPSIIHTSPSFSMFLKFTPPPKHTHSSLVVLRENQIPKLQYIWVIHIHQLRHLTVTNTVKMDLGARSTWPSITCVCERVCASVCVCVHMRVNTTKYIGTRRCSDNSQIQCQFNRVV